MIMGALLSRPVCHFLAYLYPAYQSFKAVRANDPELHTQWLVYWIVNTVFTVGELFSDQLLAWLPLYYECKIAFVAWLVLPRFKGASVLYEKFLAPYLARHEAAIDSRIDEAGRKVRAFSASITERGVQEVRKRSIDLVAAGQKFVLESLAQQGGGGGGAGAGAGAGNDGDGGDGGDDDGDDPLDGGGDDDGASSSSEAPEDSGKSPGRKKYGLRQRRGQAADAMAID